jgi:predicted RNase H-like HicB family nuclease
LIGFGRRFEAMPHHNFQVLLERDEETGAWVTHVPGLHHLSTFGETREEALANTREAIVGYFEAAAKEGIPLPQEEPAAELVELKVAIP